MTTETATIGGRPCLVCEDHSAPARGFTCRGWYIVDPASTYYYLHKDGQWSQGIKDQDLGFWPTREAAEQFIADNRTKPLTLRDLEMRAINDALDRHGGNKPEAAKELGISLKTIYNKLNGKGRGKR